ncbi:hypothetical protein JMJ55_28590 [Belnapia sp. T6]|uniref:Plasmid encoded RepA protein n=1 Tax=Belnapia mucosa TaxID=2804532 RepID=A0ABS1VC93_9PROT|nr:replication protein RepA [Belnapia mucosa]MBL6459284.1 hypothetical protein [Belnapia mucosa]
MADADGGVRDLVRVYGREKARLMVEPEQRHLVDIAAEMLADDEQKIGITYSGFCLTALPHKRLPDDQAWEKAGYHARLIVEPGWTQSSVSIIQSCSNLSNTLSADNRGRSTFSIRHELGNKNFKASGVVFEFELDQSKHNLKDFPGFRCDLPPLLMKRTGAVNIGVPYGAWARLILLYLQTQAIRTGSREVKLGRSMREWLGRMGMSWGGETGRAIKEQALRISASSLRFFWEGQDAQEWEAGRFVRSGLRFYSLPSCERAWQNEIWEDRVVLDETFYNALCQHSVPLQETALRQLADRSVSLDVYVWLAYRFNSLKVRTPIRWAALKDQFGTHDSRLSNFKRDFKKALAAAVAAYPEARVDLADDDSGLILYPSRPPVAPRLISAPRVPPKKQSGS